MVCLPAAGADETAVPEPARSSIASVIVEELPALPDAESVVGLVSVDGNAALVQSNAVWILAEDRKSWRKSDLQQPVAGRRLRPDSRVPAEAKAYLV